MNKLYAKQKNSLYAISNKANINYRNLYYYSSKENNINSMTIGCLLAIAEVEEIEPMELYESMKRYLGNKRIKKEK